MALDYNSLLASTIKNYRKGFVNNIIKDFILLAALGDKDLAPNVFKMRKPEGEFAEGIKLVDMGEKIFIPLMYAKNQTVNAYAGYDTLDITPSDPFTAAEYDWRSIAGSVNMDKERLDKNAGDAVKLFDLMKGMMDNLKVSMQETVNDYLLEPKAAGTKKPLGLMDIISDTPSSNPTVGNIGGIDVTTNSWWQNQMENQASAAFGTDQTGAGPKALRKLIRSCTFGADQTPNLIIGGDSAFESLENTMLNQIRYMSEGEKLLGKSGFQALMFKNIPVVREKRIEAIRTAAGLTGDAFYVINTKFLKLYGAKVRWFEPSATKEPVNQDTVVQHIITRCQFVTDNRRTLGVLKEIAAV
jgi:hypothetical protein